MLQVAFCKAQVLCLYMLVEVGNETQTAPLKKKKNDQENY